MMPSRELTHNLYETVCGFRPPSTRMPVLYIRLLMPPISEDCSNTFLERLFTYAAPCEWNNLSEHIRTSNFDCFKKSVKTMLFTQQYGC